MALNPPMYSAELPLALEGEAFLLSRDGMDCEINVKGMRPLKASGKVFLTTLRMVFVCKRPKNIQGTSFVAFALPLFSLRNEAFKQPIFGCNHLRGTVDPMEASGLYDSVDFKLYFTTGGAGVFLAFFLRALRDIRDPSGVKDPLSEIAKRGELLSVAVSDSKDPSVIYIAQPEIVKGQAL